MKPSESSMETAYTWHALHSPSREDVPQPRRHFKNLWAPLYRKYHLSNSPRCLNDCILKFLANGLPSTTRKKKKFANLGNRFLFQLRRWCMRLGGGRYRDLEWRKSFSLGSEVNLDIELIELILYHMIRSAIMGSSRTPEYSLKCLIPNRPNWPIPLWYPIFYSKFRIRL